MRLRGKEKTCYGMIEGTVSTCEIMAYLEKEPNMRKGGVKVTGKEEAWENGVQGRQKVPLVWPSSALQLDQSY